MKTREELGSFLNSMGLIGSGAEIGVKEGYFSNRILSSWKGSNLYMIDPWRHMVDWESDINLKDSEMEKTYEKAVSAVREFEGRYKILRMSSEEASKIIEDESLDFVYIDANHDYSHVCEDLFYWYPKVKKGGLMSGHDYLNIRKGDVIDGSDILCPETVEVKKAVDEFANEMKVNVNSTTKDFWYQVPFQSWYFIK